MAAQECALVPAAIRFRQLHGGVGFRGSGGKGLGVQGLGIRVSGLGFIRYYRVWRVVKLKTCRGQIGLRGHVGRYIPISNERAQALFSKLTATNLRP